MRRISRLGSTKTVFSGIFVIKTALKSRVIKTVSSSCTAGLMSGYQSVVLLAYSSSSFSDKLVTFSCFLLGGIQSKADKRFVVHD